MSAPQASSNSSTSTLDSITQEEAVGGVTAAVERQENEEGEVEDEVEDEVAAVVVPSLRLSTENAMRRWQHLQELVAPAVVDVVAAVAVGVAVAEAAEMFS